MTQCNDEVLKRATNQRERVNSKYYRKEDGNVAASIKALAVIEGRILMIIAIFPEKLMCMRS